MLSGFYRLSMHRLTKLHLLLRASMLALQDSYVTWALLTQNIASFTFHLRPCKAFAGMLYFHRGFCSAFGLMKESSHCEGAYFSWGETRVQFFVQAENLLENLYSPRYSRAMVHLVFCSCQQISCKWHVCSNKKWPYVFSIVYVWVWT